MRVSSVSTATPIFRGLLGQVDIELLDALDALDVVVLGLEHVDDCSLELLRDVLEDVVPDQVDVVARLVLVDPG